MKRARIIAIGLAALGGCSDGGDEGASEVPVEEVDATTTTNAAETTTTSAPQPSEAVEAYFNGVAGNTVQSARSSVEAAVPGSPAGLYAIHLAVAYATPAAPAEVTFGPDGVEICEGGQCFTATDIEVDSATGQVVDFALNGSRLGDVIRAGGSATDGPMTATVVTAYVSPLSGTLFVNVDVQTPPTLHFTPSTTAPLTSALTAAKSRWTQCLSPGPRMYGPARSEPSACPSPRPPSAAP